ncbi:MAG: glycosyltransferase family 39 protein [Anaerolineae bacterium]|nr:glycosyltransferase family 39 protein [Anaerolineae bacterium]
MQSSGTGRSSLWVEIGALVAIVLVAGFLRFTQLDAVPPGMTHDEAAFGAEAERILGGERPLYFALGYGHEPLYAYLVAVAFALFGRTLIALRLTSAVCGVLVVVGAYFVARRLYGPRTAWIAAAWMAVAFWPLSLSRQALRAVTLPLLWLPAVWCFWRGMPADGRAAGGGRAGVGRMAAYGALAGVFLGLTAYTYMASRVSWLVFPLFAATMALRRETRAQLKRAWPLVVVTLGVAALVATPLFLYLQAHPAAELRVDAMMEPVRELLAGKPERVVRHAWNALRVFSWVGDQFWGYNIPGRPVFGWTGSALLYAGLGLALWRWRDPRYAFALTWFVVGLAPAMVTTNQGIFLRAIVAQPVTYILVAEAMRAAQGGVAWLVRRIGVGAPRRWGNVLWLVLALALLTVEGVRSYRAYFVTWPSMPQARNIYNHNLVAAARYLRDQPEAGTVGISALYPLYYHDPWIVRYVTARSDLALRWFDGRGGIVYPGEGDARYLFSALTGLDPALRGAFEAQATLIERRMLDPADQNPSFEVWRWDGAGALQRVLEDVQQASPMWFSPEVRFDRPALRREIRAGAQFGDLATLLAYQLDDRSVRPGEVVELVTYWRARRTAEAEDDWVSFVHLLDADSNVVGGVDVLHCPPTGWRPGDVIVQVHRFEVGADAPTGAEAQVEIGLYRRSAGRLPVLVDGQAVGDRVLLVPVQVE